MTHAGKTAVWYCDDCTEETAPGSIACAKCCGFRSATALDDLTDGMRDALAQMEGRRAATRISWAPVWEVNKSSLYALERRGLAIINRYHQRTKLTPVGIRLAKALADAEVQS